MQAKNMKSKINLKYNNDQQVATLMLARGHHYPRKDRYIIFVRWGQGQMSSRLVHPFM